MKKLRVGVIGCGKIARLGHLPFFAGHEDVEVAAIADPEPKARDATARRFRVPHAFTSARELLGAGVCEAVVICSPHWAHREQAVEALSRGLHVLCEKPLAPTLEDADAILAAARARPELVFQVAFQKRFQTGFERMREVVRSGELGEVYHAHCYWFNWIPDFELPFMRRLIALGRRFGIDPARDLGAWRQLDPRAGGGDFLDHGPHYLDLFRYWLGEITHVSAHVRRLHPSFCHEDQANVLLKFASGATASIERSQNVVGRPHGRECGHVHGTKGSLYWESPHEYTLKAVKVRRYSIGNVVLDRGSRVGVRRGRAVASYKRQVEHFVRQVTGTAREAAPLAAGLAASAADGRRAIELVRACYRSSERNETVSVA